MSSLGQQPTFGCQLRPESRASALYWNVHSEIADDWIDISIRTVRRIGRGSPDASVNLLELDL